MIVLACAAAFAFGTVQLFELRFQGGDVYPPYSSLRADPLGTMALYESLERLPEYSVHRDLTESNRLPEERNSVYLHLAGNEYEWKELPDDMFRDIDGFLGRGGRLVITFFPRTDSYVFLHSEDDSTNSFQPIKAKHEPVDPKKMAGKKKKKVNGDDSFESYISLEDKWGFHPVFVKLDQIDDSYVPARALNQTDLPLPPVLQWHSGIVFSNVDASWRVIYSRDTNAVVLERNFGRGSVVLASDSYFVSNEALAKDRHADLLAWLVGANRCIYFDESHFGIVQSSGVAMLMRQYHLEGLAAALILLAGLLIWKNTTSLVPPQADETEEHVITGKDSASGFVNLLRRSIAPSALLALCFSEWKKSGGRAGAASTRRVQQAEAILAEENARPGRQRDPVTAYRKISEILTNLKL
jgi:hypothetical protein